MQAVEAAGLRIRKYSETSEFTMPAEFYLDNMGIDLPALRWAGKTFYRFAKILAKNKIVAVLQPT